PGEQITTGRRIDRRAASAPTVSMLPYPNTTRTGTGSNVKVSTVRLLFLVPGCAFGSLWRPAALDQHRNELTGIASAAPGRRRRSRLSKCWLPAPAADRAEAREPDAENGETGWLGNHVDVNRGFAEQRALDIEEAQGEAVLAGGERVERGRRRCHESGDTGRQVAEIEVLA